MDEVLINTQLAFFFDEPVYEPDKLWHSFPIEFTSKLNKNYTVIPIPLNEQSLNIPVISAESDEGELCTIARSRLDYYIFGKGRKDSLVDKKDLLIAKGNLLDTYIKNFNKKIKRIGFITRLFIDNKEQDKVIEKILTPDFKEKIQGEECIEGYIRYVKQIKNVDGLPFELNNYITIERFFARIPLEGENIKGYLITRDFNSPAIPPIDNKQIPYDIFIKKSIDYFNIPAIRSLL